MNNRILKNPELGIIRAALPDDEILTKCIHCGMCLATCPTYDLTKLERSSPRGRIQLIKAVADGRLEITPTFIEEMSFCLDCQACETACPAGVKYGRMVESSRVLIEDTKENYAIPDIVKKIGLNYILTNNLALRTVAFLMLLIQRSGLQFLMMKSGFLKIFNKNFNEYLKLLPKMKFKTTRGLLNGVSLKPERSRYKAAFLSGCIMDVAFSDVNLDTIQFLLKNDCEVFIPEKQVCCGSLHAHNGEMKTAFALMKKNLDAFSAEDYDYLVSNSAGCGAFMKEYGHLLSDDPVYSIAAGKFSEKVKDFSEFVHLTDFQTKLRPPDETVTYHDACHLVHSQKVSQEPRQMLAKIPGIMMENLNESTWCCGSAGIYNVTRYEDSMHFLDKKMQNLKNTRADVVLTANPGCMLQIEYGIKKYGLKMRIEHPATFLNRLIKE